MKSRAELPAFETLERLLATGVDSPADVGGRDSDGVEHSFEDHFGEIAGVNER